MLSYYNCYFRCQHVSESDTEPRVLSLQEIPFLDAIERKRLFRGQDSVIIMKNIRNVNRQHTVVY